MSKSTLDVPRAIERFAKHLYEEKKYVDVVRFGSAISRYLWLSHYNEQRIVIGKLVEDSASKVGRRKEQIAALIDDIGWTYFVIGEDVKQEKHWHWNKESRTRRAFYLAAKGERHLAGIESGVGNKDKIIEHLNKAKNFSEKITNSSEKAEMQASLYLAKAEHLFENRRYPDAEEAANLLSEFFANDLDRIGKVYSLLGNIYLAQRNFQNAKDEFNQGYNECKDVRKDEFAKNA